MSLSILEAFNTERNNRFVKDFGLGNEYLKNVVYKEAIGNELYHTVDNGVFRFSKSLSVPHSTSGLENSTPKEFMAKNKHQFELKIPKIPHKYYIMMIDWYRDVQRKEGTEACLVFFWNTDNKEIPEELYEKHKDGIIIDGQLIVYCPLQWNHGTVSKFANEEYVNNRRIARLPEMFQWFETNTDMIMETHSHHTMDAFWSGEDDANEKGRKCRMFSVYGNITNESPRHEIRIGLLGEFFTMKLEDIFEMPKKRVTEITEETNTSENLDTTSENRTITRTSNTTESILVEEIGFDLENIEEFTEQQGDTLITTKIKSEQASYYVDFTTTNSYYNDLDLRESSYPETWWNMYNVIGRTRNFVEKTINTVKEILTGEGEQNSLEIDLGENNALDTEEQNSIDKEVTIDVKEPITFEQNSDSLII